MDVLSLHDAIAAVCPINGVSVGVVTDKTTWLIDFSLSATAAQQSAAQAALTAFDPTTPAPQSVLSQDIMAQFTASDAALIQAAVASNVQFWLLWSAFQAQSDPMIVTNARFLAGWAALVQVLGAPRMAAIATALGITVQ